MQSMKGAAYFIGTNYYKLFSCFFENGKAAFQKFFADKFIMVKKISTIKETVASICKAETAIAAACVFGSYAQGKARKSSDIDVALLLDERKIAGFSVLDFITVLEKNIQRKADVVILNKADELLKYEMRRKGMLIFERSGKYRKQFEVRSRKSYEDFLYLHKKYVKRVLYGGTNGQTSPY
jgi:predicted nucleotidyltransferase